MSEIKSRSGAVLLVDDEDLLIQIFSGRLLELGYEVTAAKSGNRAYTLLEQLWAKSGPEAVKVVISDWMMPDGSGIELLRKVRRSSFPDVPFILMSGVVSRAELAQALTEGADAVLLKPFSIEALLEKIDTAVDRREMKTIKRIISN